MANQEIDLKAVGKKSEHSILIGRNPTVLDLFLTITAWKKEPAPTSFITFVGENSRGTYFEVMDRKRGEKILRELENLNVLTELPVEIIIHQSPKA